MSYGETEEPEMLYDVTREDTNEFVLRASMEVLVPAFNLRTEGVLRIKREVLANGRSDLYCNHYHFPVTDALCVVVRKAKSDGSV